MRRRAAHPTAGPSTPMALTTASDHSIRSRLSWPVRCSTSDKGVASYIEVGCSKGSTLAVITAYLSRLNPVASVGVDIRPRVSWKRVESVVNVKFHVGTSDFFKGQKFDLCFVDGYHSFEWCERDFENVGKFSKFCMFHDIYDRYCPEVGVYYNQVKNNNSVEFSSPPHDTMGIGILTL